MIGFRLALLLLLVPIAIALNVFGFVVYKAMNPPKTQSEQHGYRGTGMVLLQEPKAKAAALAENTIPGSVPYAGDEGEKAGTVYENVKVLGDVNVGEFTRLMVSMTKWVAADQGCAACHNTANFADDSLYTKVVARRMLQMVQHINSDWTKHVGETGVTCFTCHRGKLVPPHVWFSDPGPAQAGGSAQMPAGKNHPSTAAGGSALPFDPFTPFLEQEGEIRVASKTALQTGNPQSIKQAQWTYALMMNFSKSLGVNCNFCHNTRSFYSWSDSPPQRVTAWHGIRMVRELNGNYLNPLRDKLPANRLGPAAGDAPKVYCATCHNGVNKPLLGVNMVKDFPELKTKPPQHSDAR
ncbi:photosynthetic reaction center cytochrome PufC [Methylobacterium durans]|uniref:Photosynthetic reaction center cytochrome c subunit n=1 Tax=Methylobacterium durans TaxID=2202825 RepID=A0A2U8WCP7_9HYPH|nr:photosynthetic reaction center cytochrome PufC [Methylobacterium durans]AWN43052.1 photosynthetic reaction center cytochrome c subunit [Methylobacterium durans]